MYGKKNLQNTIQFLEVIKRN